MHDCQEHMTEGFLGVLDEASDCYGNREGKRKYINLHFRWNTKETMGKYLKWQACTRRMERKRISPCRQRKS